MGRERRDVKCRGNPCGCPFQMSSTVGWSGGEGMADRLLTMNVGIQRLTIGGVRDEKDVFLFVHGMYDDDGGGK